MSIDHWMLFSTFAQQNYFEYPEVGTYQGVVINANMAVHAPAGLAAFLLEKRAKTTYIIDPLTHAFQHDPEVVSKPDGGPKSTVVALAEAYGEPVLSRVGATPLQPQHFGDNAVLRGLVQRCLAFQCEQLTEQMRNSDAAKYLGGEAVEAPYAVIAPYFYMTETTIDDWLPINTESARLASELHPEGTSKVFASVVISRPILATKVLRERIAGAFKDLPLDGFLLWVDDLNEKAASGIELEGLLDLARSLRGDARRDVINLHGGYFSILAAGVLGERALSGVTHGPEFGEHRGIIPVGGGIPVARYYVPDLHARIRYRDALGMFRAKRWLRSAEAFYSEVCGCRECRATLGGDSGRFVHFGESTLKSFMRRGSIVRIDFPTREAQEHCLKHYLERKKREFDESDKGPRGDLLGRLRNGYDKFKDVAGLEGVGHLRLWERLFQSKS